MRVYILVNVKILVIMITDKSWASMILINVHDFVNV